MKSKAILLICGLAAVLFHYFVPGLVPDNLDLIVGLIVVVVTSILLIQWIVVETRDVPAVEELRPDTEDLREATDEILYLLEEGWGVKRIVDMISANYQLPPKMVYEHVMELMSSRHEGMETPDQGRTVESISMPPSENGEEKDEQMKIIRSNIDEE